ncbi:MAG: diadenylate cyclase CdaA [Oscillospiraceae bacterium]|nr:diadenylate cyclase CdaA [Oscillospiraceae bacterium]
MDWMLEALRLGSSYLKLVNFTDVLDIAIVSYVVYRLLLFFRKSRSGQVVRAIAFILAAMILSNLLNLYIVSFLLNRAVEMGLIAIIIIFQPELRRFLERIGSGKLSGVFTKEEAPEDLEQAIQQTVAAYAAFSRDKVGALMVFERHMILDDVLKSGTELDAAVSSELLKNLFWNKAPMHDGAVIIRGGRIAGAGCMLPLSSNINLSRDLGMRHRAGIGMSENSDAVVAIVSEETGSISVAIGGMLKRHLAPETLERLLRKELLPEEADAPGEDWRGKLSGLLKTVLLKKGDKTDGQEDS